MTFMWWEHENLNWYLFWLVSTVFFHDWFLKYFMRAAGVPNKYHILSWELRRRCRNSRSSYSEDLKVRYFNKIENGSSSQIPSPSPAMLNHLLSDEGSGTMFICVRFHQVGAYPRETWWGSLVIVPLTFTRRAGGCQDCATERSR